MSYGQLTQLAIGFQNSYGTANTASLYPIAMLSEDLGLQIPPLESQALRGIHDPGDNVEGPRMVAGTVTTEANVKTLGVMLKALMADSVATIASGVYQHKFHLRNTDWDTYAANQPCTIYKSLEVGSSYQYSDMVGNTLELHIANGEFLTCAIGFVGGNFTQVVPSAKTFFNENKFTWQTVSLSVGGAALTDVTELTVSVDETIEAMHTLNASRYPSRAKRTGFRSVEVSGTFKFRTQDDYQQFIAQSERQLDLHFGLATEVASGYPEYVTIVLPKMRYSELKPAAGGPGYIEASFTAAGKYSTTSVTALYVLLQNSQAAY